MGATQSIIGGPKISRTQLLQSTNNNRNFMNNLFRVMIEKLTPEDFLKLGKSQTCSSFVFMMANSIQKLFEDLRIRPAQAKDTGVVFFQKIDTLKQKTQTDESRKLCLYIAYFYIRIFQIFGALALSVIDDPGAGSVLDITRYAAPLDTAQRKFPGQRVVPFYGGAEPSQLAGSQFRPIASLLGNKTIQRLAHGATRIYYPFEYNDELSLIPSRKDERGQSQNLSFNMGYNTHLYGNLSITQNPSKRENLTEYKVVLSNFKVSDASKSNLNKINSQIKGYTQTFLFYKTKDDEYSFVDKDFQSFGVAEKIQEIINTVLTIINQIEENPIATLESLGYRKKKEVEKSREEQQKREDGTVKDAFIPKPLQYEYIIQALKQMAGYKATSFCVARAIQLLDADTLFNPKNPIVKSGVCLPKFDKLPISVPESRVPVTRIPGIKVLDQLFYDKPTLDVSDKSTAQVTDIEAYHTFLQELSSIFGTSAGAGSLTDADKILAKDPNCPAIAAKKYLQIQDPKAVQAVLQVVGLMFHRQAQHTQKVVGFIKSKLILLQKGNIEIHPKLLTNGLGELNSLAKEARIILLEYYKNCEDMYQKGVQTVLAAKSIPIG